MPPLHVPALLWKLQTQSTLTVCSLYCYHQNRANPLPFCQPNSCWELCGVLCAQRRGEGHKTGTVEHKGSPCQVSRGVLWKKKHPMRTSGTFPRERSLHGGKYAIWFLIHKTRVGTTGSDHEGRLGLSLLLGSVYVHTSRFTGAESWRQPMNN